MSEDQMLDLIYNILDQLDQWTVDKSLEYSTRERAEEAMDYLEDAYEKIKELRDKV